MGKAKKKAGEATIHSAADDGDVDSVLEFIAADSSATEKKNKDGMIATFRFSLKPHAIASEDSGVIRLARARLVRQLHPSGWTALHAAAFAGELDVVNALLKAKANVQVTVFAYVCIFII